MHPDDVIPQLRRRGELGGVGMVRPMKVFYSPEYIRSEQAFDTTRKAGWIAASLLQFPIPGISICKPTPVTDRQLKRVHSVPYVDSVRTGRPRCLSETSGFSWDPGVWTATTFSTGGVLEAARVALESGQNSGSLSSGLHHAKFRRGDALCTFNGLALASLTLASEGAEILILDLDAHCGGGTHELTFKNSKISHLDISVCGFDCYRPGPQERLMILSTRSGYNDYLGTIRRELKRLDAKRFDLVLYNAGMDPFTDTALSLIEATRREELVFQWAESNCLPVAFVLAGGYTGGLVTPAHVVQLHRLTLTAAR